MDALIAAKKAARIAAYEIRAAAQAAGAGRQAAGHLLDEIARLRNIRTVAGYLPIRNELDPLPAMFALHGLGFRLCLPVIEQRKQPLRFRAWSPGCRTEEGAFGVTVPCVGDWIEPDLLLVPLLAFDGRGIRLGYGGGFYDRTIAALRGKKALTTLGFGYAAQETGQLPAGPHDAPLDAIVTEAGVVRPGLALDAAVEAG